MGLSTDCKWIDEYVTELPKAGQAAEAAKKSFNEFKKTAVKSKEMIKKELVSAIDTEMRRTITETQGTTERCINDYLNTGNFDAFRFLSKSLPVPEWFLDDIVEAIAKRIGEGLSEEEYNKKLAKLSSDNQKAQDYFRKLKDKFAGVDQFESNWRNVQRKFNAPCTPNGDKLSCNPYAEKAYDKIFKISMAISHGGSNPTDPTFVHESKPITYVETKRQPSLLEGVFNFWGNK